MPCSDLKAGSPKPSKWSINPLLAATPIEADLLSFRLLGIGSIHPTPKSCSGNCGMLVFQSQGAIGHQGVDLDSVHAVVHHAHEIPGERVGLCVHIRRPGSTTDLLGLQKLHCMHKREVSDHRTAFMTSRWSVLRGCEETMGGCHNLQSSQRGIPTTVRLFLEAQ